VLKGPDIAFKPQNALALSLVFHELVTNALKYGALSKSNGSLSIEWRFEGGNGGGPRLVVIDWKEKGGPAVSKPKKQGFGGDLIDRQIAQLNGSIVRDFAKAGLSLQISLPVESKVGLH
jgi:two-component sensor histidine kinase